MKGRVRVCGGGGQGMACRAGRAVDCSGCSGAWPLLKYVSYRGDLVVWGPAGRAVG